MKNYILLLCLSLHSFGFSFGEPLKPGHGFTIEQGGGIENKNVVYNKVVYDYMNTSGFGYSVGMILASWESEVDFDINFAFDEDEENGYSLRNQEVRHLAYSLMEFSYSRLFFDRVVLRGHGIPALSTIDLVNTSGVEVVDPSVFSLGLGLDTKVILYKGDFTWFMLDLSGSKFFTLNDYEVQDVFSERKAEKKFSRTSPFKIKIGVSFLFGRPSGWKAPVNYEERSYELERIHQLKKEGVLTEEEYQIEKMKIMNNE